MRNRRKVRGGTADSVEWFCAGVWFTGHLAALFTLGMLISYDHQDLVTGQQLPLSQPDAGPDEADRTL